MIGLNAKLSCRSENCIGTIMTYYTSVFVAEQSGGDEGGER